MREAVGIFGLVAGVIVVTLVARYGFVTSDTALDGAIVAFFFAVIAIGGLGGPAVAVHLWKNAAKLWGAVAGIVAGVALLANLSNSLGAIASRADKTQAQRAMASDGAKDDRAELIRISAERTKLPSARPAGTVEADIEAQRASKAYKSSNGCDPDQITAKATREACDAFRRLEGELATAQAAARLDAAAAAARGRLAKAQPVGSVNPLGDTLGRLLSVPAEIAATWQQVATVVVVELLIAFGLLAWELLAGRSSSPGLPGSTTTAPEHEPAPVETSVSVPLSAKRRVKDAPPARCPRPATPPRKVALIETGRAPGDIAKFAVAYLRPASGSAVAIPALYQPYREWCDEHGFRAETVERFEELFAALCDLSGFKRLGDECLGLRLAA
jgi:hypothetical protein